MPKPVALKPLLDHTQTAFISHGVSIHIATCDPLLIPAITCAVACRVSADQQQVTVFSSEARAEKLLANIAHNGMIAVVFSQPGKLRTLQLKGEDAHRISLQDDDDSFIQANSEALVAALTKIGHSFDFARTIVAHDSPLIAIRFTPNRIFDHFPGQFPGPDTDRQSIQASHVADA